MTRKYEQAGDVLDHTASSAITVGAVVPMGNIVGVAMTDIANGEDGAVAVDGVFELAKTTGTAWNQGDVLDFDVSTGKFGKSITPATGDVTGCAVAANAAASGASTGNVLLRAIPGTVQ